MNGAKSNRFLLWMAILLLSGNLIILSLMWFKEPINNVHHPIKEMINRQNRNNFECRFADELKLNPQQTAKYHKLMKQHMASMKVLRDSIRQKKWLIHQELVKENSDINYINELSDSIGQLNAEFEKLNYSHFFELKNELSNEQLDKFRVLLEKLPYGHRHHDTRGRHRNR